MAGPHVLRERVDAWLRQAWHDANKDKNDSLSLGEITQLCKKLNINCPAESLVRVFNMIDSQNQGFIDFSGFAKIIHLLRHRNDIGELFDSIAKECRPYLTLEEFIYFRVHVQKERLEDAEHIFYKYCEEGSNMMDIKGFLNFLLLSDNLPTRSETTRVYQDMDQPLSHYFIASSHNTYLLGDQVVSESSVEGYIRALQKGCRCVELDCWDGPNNEPIIYHGRTLTSKILFRDAVEAIRKYAFVASPFPLILSFETHCSPLQQEVMAKILLQVLDGLLLLKPLGEQTSQLPTPNQLLYKILIKNKTITPESDEAFSSTSEEDSIDENGYEATVKIEKAVKLRKPKVAKLLSDMVVYCKATHFKFFDLNHLKHDKIISMNESKALKLCQKEMATFIEHNKVQLTRVYPKTMRLNSSNFDPMIHWLSGTQVVALNYQTYDRCMQIYEAMFYNNGGCGYVLKPEYLRIKEMEPPLPELLEVEL
ncbi:hypothetical protein K7432_017315 [Basidiobolus ranarum]|uniref:Phosphoinositide phospholipase C n=1 Tax=Basidiobolus ranarum TaxID=34480 RepID=A0ABR2WDJ4_9FUNG